MIPCTFEGLSFFYRDVNPKDGMINILLDLYDNIINPFLSKEIGEIQKRENDDKKELEEDENFLIKRSIAQNMHFLFGCFMQAIVDCYYIENDKWYRDSKFQMIVDKDRLKKAAYDIL